MYGISPRLRGDLKLRKTSISSRQTPVKTINTMLHIPEQDEIEEDSIGELNSHFLILDIKNTIKKPTLEMNTNGKNPDKKVM